MRPRGMKEATQYFHHYFIDVCESRTERHCDPLRCCSVLYIFDRCSLLFWYVLKDFIPYYHVVQQFQDF